MSRASSMGRGGLGPALRWAGAGALVLGVHLGAGALLLGRSMLPRQPDAAVVGIPIDLEPVTVPQDETATAPAPTAAPPMPLEAPAAAEPPPAAQAGEPPLADPTSAEPRLATAEVPPAPAIPPETPPPLPEAQVDAEPPAPPPPALLPPALLPELPKARKAEDAVLARPPLPRLKPKPKPKSVAHPPKTPVDRDAAEREVAQQERREARREAAWQRATDRRAAAAAAAPAREPAEAQPRASAGEVASWRGALVAHLNRFKRSPPGGASGTARVSFSVTASGGVSGVRLASSSGDPALDEAALTMVQRADPVPAPPSGMGGRVSLSVPVHFSGP